MQKQSISSITPRYYFLRMKDTQNEYGEEFITLFSRLTIEMSESSKCVWVDIKDITCNQATHQLNTMDNGIYTNRVQEEVFLELQQTGQEQQNALYALTPVHQAMTFRQLTSIRSISE